MNNLTPNIRTERCTIHPALRSLIRHIVIIEADFGNIPVSLAGNYMPSPDQAMFINLYTRLKSNESAQHAGVPSDQRLIYIHLSRAMNVCISKIIYLWRV